MARIGFGDLKDQGLHALWDLAELKKMELEDGTSMEQMLREVQDVASAVSGEITRLPHYSTLFNVQDAPEIEYGTFTGGGIQEMTEYSVPDPYKGKTTGHMLPIKMFTRSIGWTFLALERRRRNQLEADLNVVVDDIRNHYQQKVLTRFFKMEADAVGDTAGASVPFADGGVGDANWIPLRSPEGVEFDASHDHYLRVATLDTAAIVAAVKHLKEHGHQPPYDLIGADLDAATYQALDEWRAPVWNGIIYRDTSAGTDRASLNGIEEYDGYMETTAGVVKIWFTPRLPTGYFGIYKDYGPGADGAPCAMRINPKLGFGWQMVPGNYVNSPLNLGVLRSEFDLGIGKDRTNGVFTKVFASGDYVTPAIS